jgi:hypothetical protein
MAAIFNTRPEQHHDAARQAQAINFWSTFQQTVHEAGLLPIQCRKVGIAVRQVANGPRYPLTLLHL